MRRHREAKDVHGRVRFDAKWGVVLVAGALIIGLAALLDPVLEPYLGRFSPGAALVTFALVVLVGYVAAAISRLIGR
jgi:hypothetical protein